ncbi:MAG: hypothetical protein ACT4O9_05510 [Blastocatellia bacterium]
MTGNENHIEFEQLTDYVLEETTSKQKSILALHIENCRICAMKARRIEQTLFAMRTDNSEYVPSFLSERVIDLFDTISNQTEFGRKSNLIEKLTAVLNFDRLVPVTGLRYGNSEFTRQLEFSAGNTFIEVRMEQAGPDGWRISGSVRAEYVGGIFEITNEDSLTISTEIDDFSDFVIQPVKPGTYAAVIIHEHARIEFPPLVIE